MKPRVTARPGRRWWQPFLSLVVAPVIVACQGPAVTPNPAVFADLRSMTGSPIKGGVGLHELSSTTLLAAISMQPTADLPPLAAEVRRGDCASEIVVSTLTLIDPDDRFSFEGNINGTFASVLPVAVVVLEASTGTVIGCGLLTHAP
jgi:hypothetical protein